MEDIYIDSAYKPSDATISKREKSNLFDSSSDLELIAQNSEDNRESASSSEVIYCTEIKYCTVIMCMDLSARNLKINGKEK